MFAQKNTLPLTALALLTSCSPQTQSEKNDPFTSVISSKGGKLIMYHGSTDGLIPAGNSVNYFSSVNEALGKERVSNSARFYLVNGMDHCAGGEGAWSIDWLGAMENWVETDEPPEILQASHPDLAEQSKSFTRPQCPWPSQQQYLGGDPDNIASFTCSITQEN